MNVCCVSSHLERSLDQEQRGIGTSIHLKMFLNLQWFIYFMCTYQFYLQPKSY